MFRKKSKKMLTCLSKIKKSNFLFNNCLEQITPYLAINQRSRVIKTTGPKSSEERAKIIFAHLIAPEKYENILPKRPDHHQEKYFGPEKRKNSLGQKMSNMLQSNLKATKTASGKTNSMERLPTEDKR